MWSGAYDLVRESLADLLAVTLAGASIKLLDDCLDLEDDVALGYPSLAQALGGGGAAAAYALVCATLACALDVRLAGSLVLAAYAVGMFKDPLRMLPLGLPAWMESAAAVVASWVLFGWRLALVSLLLMTCVQLADDVRDWARDRALGSVNAVRRLGRGAALVLCAVSAFAACVLDLRAGVLVLAGAAVVEAAAGAAARVAAGAGGEDDDG